MFDVIVYILAGIGATALVFSALVAFALVKNGHKPNGSA
jgi:hypothetical protein